VKKPGTKEERVKKRALDIKIMQVRRKRRRKRNKFRRTVRKRKCRYKYEK
jgi:hypothetical protein